MSDTQQTPSKPAVPEHHHHDELAEVKQFIETYGKPLATAVLVVLVAVAVFQITSTRRRNQAEQASARLSEARSIPDLEAILSDFGKTAAAPQALLSLAKLYFDNGNYEIAFSKYEEFINTYPENRMLPTAKLGRAYCIEARNYESALQEAAVAFRDFAAENADSFLAPQAIFGQARCYEQLGQLEDARMVYEDFLSKQPEGLWSLRAEDQLEQLGKKIEKAQAGMPPITPAEIPAAAPVAIPGLATPVEIPAVEPTVAEVAPATATPAATSEATIPPSPQPVPPATDEGK